MFNSSALFTLKENIGPPQKPLLRKRDYDGNGIDEYVSMEIPEVVTELLKLMNLIPEDISLRMILVILSGLDIGSTYILPVQKVNCYY